MEELFDSFSDNLTNWETVRDVVDLETDEDVQNRSIKKNPRIHLFPRQDLTLYGTIPKMEKRIFSKCKDCRLIFNPQDILFHKTCKDIIIPVKSNIFGKKLKNKNGSIKKTLPPAPSFLETTTLTPTTETETKYPIIVETVTNITDTKETSSPKPITESPSNFLTPNKSKKSRRGNSSRSLIKEFVPDLHCGVIEGNKGPCTRSITCSNHRIQFKKMVQGRSKDVHQLIADRRIARDKELKQTTEQEQDIVNVSVKLEPVLIIDPINVDKLEDNIETLDIVENVQKVEKVPVDIPRLHKPMSPPEDISAKDSSSEPTSNIPITTDKSISFKIPDLDSDLKMYKSHPKPTVFPTYGMRKFGGAMLFSNLQIQTQRNDVLRALNSSSRLNSTLNCVNSFNRVNNIKVKRTNYRSGLDGFDIESKQIRLDRRYSNHFVLQYDSDSMGDGMQENIGFKKL